MTIQPIGNASVALYITPADLKEHGLTPAGLTLERALELTRDAFHEAGITLDGSIEIEAYPNACAGLCPRAGPGASLVFLRQSGPAALRRPRAAGSPAGRAAFVVGGALLALTARRRGSGCGTAFGIRPLGGWPPSPGGPPCRARPSRPFRGRARRSAHLFPRLAY